VGLTCLVMCCCALGTESSSSLLNSRSATPNIAGLTSSSYRSEERSRNPPFAVSRCW